MRTMTVDLAECRPLSTWKPIHGDFLINSRMLATTFGLVTEVDNVKETVDIVFAASPQVLLSLSPSERSKRKKQLDLRQLKESKTHTVIQNYGGKSIWYLR